MSEKFKILNEIFDVITDRKANPKMDPIQIIFLIKV